MNGLVLSEGYLFNKEFEDMIVDLLHRESFYYSATSSGLCITCCRTVYSVGAIANSIGFDIADFINGLLALISFPQTKTAIGAAAKTNEINPRRELAQWNPKLVYMLLEASGKNATPKFSPRTVAPMALPA